MNRRLMLVCSCAMALLGTFAVNANAQTSSKWQDTGYLHIDGGVQGATPDFSSTVTFPLYGETGTFTASYKYVSAGLIGGRAGFRIIGNLAFGVGVTRFSRAGEAAVTALLPHPFHFNQTRRISGTATGLTREELMAAAELSWVVRLGRRVDLMVMVGPAYFSTRQDMATLPRYTEIYPYDTATFAGVESRRVSKTGVGFTAGLDLSVMLSRNLGLGALVRYSRANASFSAAAGSTSSVTLGGTQASAGVRIRF